MKKKKADEKSGLFKFFIFGIIAAIVLFFILNNINKDDNTGIKNSGHVWSPETDSQFVKSCYNKYKSQIMDDPVKKESTKSFCRCMLEKIKTKYSEEEMNNVKDSDIKFWDSECRNEVFNKKF